MEGQPAATQRRRRRPVRCRLHSQGRSSTDTLVSRIGPAKPICPSWDQACLTGPAFQTDLRWACLTWEEGFCQPLVCPFFGQNVKQVLRNHSEGRKLSIPTERSCDDSDQEQSSNCETASSYSQLGMLGGCARKWRRRVRLEEITRGERQCHRHSRFHTDFPAKPLSPVESVFPITERFP